ncbi:MULTISPECIES: 6-phosphofructokinase [Dethiosulfovibrio]|uniref:ATP-dependent 6-phosphofructokinase n=2 Tax=Dethiosulfovibrio TaxID=47054 RepID=A0ABS9ELU2_9BACT|nr:MULTISPECIES: 6-phosphofructokinase [Dethiosulfovibrio]MCF4113918.1 6-phosphofructokinase [Dethiosulfovibrio russensis]MCF4141669.1 6-phosphofructokinase [Dethiosulfovibrio marinus]MCF4143914.1 6-phosphofructokinase [Dethiosulfovibrio acidaminovorans]
MKRIAVLTSGGDAPGMNAAIRAVTRSAIYDKAEVYGVYQGYEGLMDGAFQRLEPRDVGGIIHRGGTILRTARSERFRTDEGLADAVASLERHSIDGLVVIGGDGSFKGAYELHKLGVPVVGVPGTIDNDVAGTDETIGYDTALNTALEAVKKLRDTASSHDRLFIVEVMGREAGFLALNVAVASGAEFVVVPERKFDVGFLCDRLHQSRKAGKQHSLIVVAEGAMSAVELKDRLKDTGGYDARVTVLGYIQRGGSPTSFDTILASRMGAFAVDRLMEGESGIMVGTVCHEMVAAPLSRSWEGRKPLNPELIELVDRLSI